jgi:hypothetical protein
MCGPEQPDLHSQLVIRVPGTFADLKQFHGTKPLWPIGDPLMANFPQYYWVLYSFNIVMLLMATLIPLGIVWIKSFPRAMRDHPEIRNTIRSFWMATLISWFYIGLFLFFKYGLVRMIS